MKYLKIFLYFLFSFCFLPILNAESNTYFDLPQISVNELPTASSDTLNKIYVIDNKYYVTNEIVIGGTPTYLPLNENLKGTTIYYDPQPFIDYYNQNGCNGSIKWASITGGSFFQTQFICYQGSWSVPIRQSYYYYSNSDTRYQAYTSNVYLYTPGSSYYVTQFEPISDFTITEVIEGMEWFYHSFSSTPLTSTITYEWSEITEEQVYRVIPEKIFVPSDNLYCYHFISDNVLRGYVDNPVVNNNVNYYDFNIDYHYRQSTGTELITELPVCLANTTTDFYYRNDVVEIILYFVLVALIIFFIPYKIMSVWFRRKI